MPDRSESDAEKLAEEIEDYVKEGDGETAEEIERKYKILFKNFRFHPVSDIEDEGGPSGVEYSDLTSATSASAVTGTNYHVAFEIENVGDSQFPGARLFNMQSITESATLNIASEREIGTLEVGDEETITLHHAMTNPGHITYNIDVEASDGEAVEVRHEGEDVVTIDTIRYSMRVVEREQLLMLAELREIRRQLEE